MQKEKNQLVSSRSVGALLATPISRRPTDGNIREARWREGFTLLELVITVIIIAVLAALAVSAYQKAVLKSRFSAVIPSTKTIANAQELYYMNEGSYAANIRNLDIKLNDDNGTVTLSDKKNYKYVMGTPNGTANNHYIVYQKHSKRFANDIHCEAQKDDALANWLCETALGGTLIAGSINGSNWLTYLLSGEGNGKFLRTDCPAGQYDEEGVCTSVHPGYYAEDGEEKLCAVGTYQPSTGGSSCQKCPAGKYSDIEGASQCKTCPHNMYTSVTGATECQKCPAGTHSQSGKCGACPAGKYGDTEGGGCKTCPYNMYTSVTGATECQKCPAGTYSQSGKCGACPVGKYGDTEGGGCKTCPEGTINTQTGSTSIDACIPCPAGMHTNGAHTVCV